MAHLKKKQTSALQANLGRRTNTEKEKIVKLFSAKRMSYRLVDAFASCAWYLSGLRSFQGVISVLRSIFPVISKQMNKLLKNCFDDFLLFKVYFSLRYKTFLNLGLLSRQCPLTLTYEKVWTRLQLLGRSFNKGRGRMFTDLLKD